MRTAIGTLKDTASHHSDLIPNCAKGCFLLPGRNYTKQIGSNLLYEFSDSKSLREALSKGVSGAVGGRVDVSIRHPLRNVYLNPCSVKRKGSFVLFFLKKKTKQKTTLGCSHNNETCFGIVVWCVVVGVQFNYD